MDEMSLFYRLEVDYLLATKQFEGCKKDKERIAMVVCNDNNNLWLLFIIIVVVVIIIITTNNTFFWIKINEIY